jgi:hypothetical protein
MMRIVHSRFHEWGRDIRRSPDDEPVVEEYISVGCCAHGSETTLDNSCLYEASLELDEDDEGP